MKKKKKKIEKISYQPDNLFRWNMCQKLASVMYHSTLGEHQIQDNIELVLENFSSIKK